MNYYFDTEFHEKYVNCNGRGKIFTLDIISLGLCDEDGRLFYQIHKDHNLDDGWENEWLIENVYKQIYYELVPESQRKVQKFDLSTMKFLFHQFGETKKKIASSLLSFIGKDPDVHLYGYYADYDHVCLGQLFGKMIDFPKHFPKYTLDLMQIMFENGLDSKWKKKNCPDPKNEHSAKNDALWNLELHKQIIKEINK